MSIDLQPYALMLVCPACRSKLLVDERSFLCRSESCRLRYEVKDDIPVMLADEAKQVAPDDWAAIVQRVQSNNS
ncbi:MAG: Trm112 family protein [Planctomycetaceae bacterium]